MAVNPYGPPQAAPAAAAKPAANPYASAFPNPGQAAYANIPGAGGWDISQIPRGPTALTRNYGADPFHPTVQVGIPANQNARWEWASPADYRGYAKAQQAAAGTVNPGGSMIGYTGTPLRGAASATGATAAGTGAVPTLSQILASVAGTPASTTPAAPGLAADTPYEGLTYGTNQATAPAVGTAGTAASSTPNYDQLIASDPIFHQAVQDALAGKVQDERTRSAATQTALANFGDVGDISGSLSQLGLDPSSPLYQSLLGDVNAATPQGQALTSAGLSQTAQMARDHAANIEHLIQTAPMLQSGGTGSQLAGIDQDYSQTQYTARANVLSYLAGVQQAYLTAQQTSRSGLITAATDAGTRVAGLYPVAPNYSTVPGQVGTSATAPSAPAAPAAVPYYPLGSGGPAPRTRVVAPPNTSQIGRNR